MLPTREQMNWAMTFVGRPAENPPPANVGTQAAAPQGVQSPEKLPRPMEADCKVVHGQVPGPKNFVLCATHGHILDTDKKLIVATNLKEFNAAHPEFGKLPAPMMPDCAIVRGKVPGPKHHVLCGTHGHVLDEEKQQIIAHSLSEYIRHHAPAKQNPKGPSHSPARQRPETSGPSADATAASPATSGKADENDGNAMDEEQTKLKEEWQKNGSKDLHELKIWLDYISRHISHYPELEETLLIAKLSPKPVTQMHKMMTAWIPMLRALEADVLEAERIDLLNLDETTMTQAKGFRAAAAKLPAMMDEVGGDPVVSFLKSSKASVGEKQATTEQLDKLIQISEVRTERLWKALSGLKDHVESYMTWLREVRVVFSKHPKYMKQAGR